MEINEIKYGIDSQFHMLRHFIGITAELRNELLASGRTEDVIEKELDQVGSRFYSDFADDINGLLKRLIDGGYEEEKGVNGNIVLKGKADMGLFPKGVGTLSVVSLNDIPKTKRKEIYHSKNRGVDLMHFKVEDLPSTNNFTIILKPTQTTPVFITAFPGLPAMPLPERNMQKLVYDQCVKYWNSHVFLVKSEVQK